MRLERKVKPTSFPQKRLVLVASKGILPRLRYLASKVRLTTQN